jgi:hypothetical protein
MGRKNMGRKNLSRDPNTHTSSLSHRIPSSSNGGRHHAFAAWSQQFVAPCLTWPTDELPLQELPLQQWSSGICDCCSTLITPSGEPVGGCCFCCKAVCCACMVFSDNTAYMSESEGVSCAGEENSTKACLLYYAAGQRVPK